MKKRITIFSLERSAPDQNGKLKKLSIGLSVDYLNKKYWLTTNSGRISTDFTFVSGNGDKTASAKWQALFDMMREATIFAENELYGTVQTSEPKEKSEMESHVEQVTKMFDNDKEEIHESHKTGVVSL